MPPDPTPPAPPPEWAMRMADAYVTLIESMRGASGYTHGGVVRSLGTLLASVRDGALREAAGKCCAVSARMKAIASAQRDVPGHDIRIGYIEGVRDVGGAILALLGTAPRESASEESPRG